MKKLTHKKYGHEAKTKSKAPFANKHVHTLRKTHIERVIEEQAKEMTSKLQMWIRGM